MNEKPSSISEAQSALKKHFPKVQFIAATSSFLTATYHRSPTANVKVKVTLTFPDGYSSAKTTLVVTVEGTNVPTGLKRKLEKELGDAAQTKEHTYDQIEAVLKRLVEFIDTNRFVPCWKELRQVVELINSHKDYTIRMNENTGLIRLTLQQGKYQYKCSINIDPEYPNTANLADYGNPCRLKLESTNFPASVEAPITKHAMELVRRLQDGMPEEFAKKMSNPMPLPSTIQPGETEAEAWQRQDMERRKQHGVPLDPPYDGSQPQPSLLSLVQFLNNTLARIPNETCPSCGERCLATDPAKQPKTKSKRPILSHCGHWYHWGCMDKLMNEPPFGIDACCQKCGKRLFHTDWTEEGAPERERSYHQRQAKEREIADAADFF